MEDLKTLREKINKIDDEMARLFVERMEVSEQIYQAKSQLNLPIFDAQRETENLLNSEIRVSPFFRPYYTEFLIKCMELSKKYQTYLKEQGEAADEK